MENNQQSSVDFNETSRKRDLDTLNTLVTRFPDTPLDFSIKLTAKEVSAILWAITILKDENYLYQVVTREDVR